MFSLLNTEFHIHHEKSTHYVITSIINKRRSWHVIFLHDQAFGHVRSKTIKVASVNIHKKTFLLLMLPKQPQKSWVNLWISVGFSSTPRSTAQRSAHTNPCQLVKLKKVKSTCKLCHISVTWPCHVIKYQPLTIMMLTKMTHKLCRYNINGKAITQLSIKELNIL